MSGKMFRSALLLFLIAKKVILDKTDGFDIPNQYYNEGDHNFDTVVLHQPTNMCTGRAKDRSPTFDQTENFWAKMTKFRPPTAVILRRINRHDAPVYHHHNVLLPK